MSAVVVAIGLLTGGLAGLALLGLIVRRRVKHCAAFTAYLLSAAVGHPLIVGLPEVFWTWQAWLAFDWLQTALRVAVAIELAVRTFRPLPPGYPLIMRLLALLGFATLVIVVATFTPPSNAAEWTLVAARVSYGVAFLFGAFVVFAGHHGVPLDPLHREIALGFVALSLLVAFAHPLSSLDPLIGLGHYSVSMLTYPLILAGWVWSAWRPEPPSGLSAETLARLRPWRMT